jgi:hypothetical protein
MVFVAGMSLSASVAAVADAEKDQPIWDVDLQLAQPAPIGDVTSALSGLSAVARVEGLAVALTGLGCVLWIFSVG